MTDTFETFWTDYPRKVAKEAARKAYAKAVKAHGADTILKGLQAWNLVRKPTEPQWIVHASRWLNEKRYLDDFETLGQNAMGFHKVPPKFCVNVNGRDYGVIEMMRVRDQIRRRQPVYDPEWTAFKKWQEHGHDSDVKLPPEPAKLPTPEEREAISKKWLEMKERGLL